MAKTYSVTVRKKDKHGRLDDNYPCPSLEVAQKAFNEAVGRFKWVKGDTLKDMTVEEGTWDFCAYSSKEIFYVYVSEKENLDAADIINEMELQGYFNK